MKFGRILIFILAFLLIENCFNLDRKTKKLKRKSVKIKKRRQNEPVLNCGNMFIATICDLLNKEVLKEYAKAVASTFKNMNVLQVDLPNLDFDNIASSEKTPKLLSLAIKGIGLSMKFTNNKVMVAFNPTTVNVRIQTKVKENDIDLFILKKDADPVFILSTKIPMNNIYEFIEKFSGIKIGESNPLRWIESSSISLLFSSGAYSFSDYPKEMAPTYFESKGLLGTGKNTQLIIEAMIKIAASKEKSKINDFIRFLIPDKLILGLKVDSQAIDANIGLTNVKLSEKFTLAYGGVFFKITYASPQSPEIGFKGSLKFPVATMKEKEGDEPEEEKESEKNFLVLGGSIAFTPLDLKFTFSLDSIWNPFGLKRFHAGNLYFETAVNYETIVPTALKLAGEFAIGLECYEIKENKAVFNGSGRCIQAKAAVFIDVIKIGENGFMLEVAKLDFQTFANALFAKTATEVYPVNGFLQNLISFPDGLKVSFAPKSFTVGSVSIDGGIQVKATIESFHKKAKFEVKIGFTLIPNMKIRIEIEEEIKVADLVVISRTGEAPKNEVAPIIPEDDDKKKEKEKRTYI